MLGWPGALSQGGFLARDEDILSVLKGDNEIVKKMGLTHPQLAKPLFYVLNMMDTDLRLNRWNMIRHQWENIQSFFYSGKEVLVVAEDTKGGQQSIFDDGIEGAFYIRLWREWTREEEEFIKKKYPNLTTEELQKMKDMLAGFNTGEMQPQYIMRYGFYEGHTYWRVDPIAIAFIFGIKGIQELDADFDGMLYDVMTQHHTAF